MELTILVPDELGSRVRRLADPDGFVTEALRRALGDQADTIRDAPQRPSRWARLAAEIEADPFHLDGYSEQLDRDSREFREDFVFQHDRES